jgi:AcrR family transcriptional regulator
MSVKRNGDVERTATASRVYGGLSAGERSANRRKALLEAALDLFTEGGSRAVSRRAVCARARLNERYFYELFSNADALLEAVIRDQTAGVLDVVVEASTEVGTDIVDRTSNIARSALEFLTADPRRGALLLDSHSSDVLQRMKRESAATIAKLLTTLFHDPLRPSAPSAADTELVAYALVSGAMELTAGWLRGDLDITAERCAELVAGLLLSVPRIPSTASPGG